MRCFGKNLLWLAPVLALAGCGGGGGSVSAPPTPAGSPDPTGGTWKPVLVNQNTFNISAPPAEGSAQAQNELNELVQIQASPSRSPRDEVQHWQKGAVIRWNEIARELVIKNKTNPPMAARAYALLSVAQYDALVMAWKFKYQYNRPFPSQRDSRIKPKVPLAPDPGYPCDHSAVGAASANVLAHLFPQDAAFINQQVDAHTSSRMFAGVSARSDVEAGIQIGMHVAAQVNQYADGDRSSDPWTGTVPTGTGVWFSSANPPALPLLPNFGTVKTWLVPDVVAMRAPAPPAFGSPAFLADLQEVRQLSDNRTPEQAQIAKFWADGAGTATPPGHWNQILCDVLVQRPRNELRNARALALLNMSELDAAVCCWDTKYAYWLLRPSQADPAITLVVGLPNFPAYTSGHSTFSGAAAEVIGYLYPDLKQQMKDMAIEAGMSRLYGGIHYRFDSETGLDMGYEIGKLAAQRGNTDGSPK